MTVPSSEPSTERADGAAVFTRPYVISWNLTYRCNLACEHCYLDAGGKPAIDTPAFADRSELDTEQCFRVFAFQFVEFSLQSRVFGLHG